MANEAVRGRIFTFQRSYTFDVHGKDKETGKQSTEITWDISEADWRKSVIEDVKSYSVVDEIWLVFHDKDVDSDGNAKPLHAHGIIVNKDAVRSTAIADALKINNDGGRQVTKVRKESGIFRYLTHTSDAAMKAKKWRYDIDELHFFKHGVEVQDRAEVRSEYTKRVAGSEGKSKDNLVDFGNGLVGQVAANQITLSEASNALSEKYGIEGISWHARNLTAFKNAMELRRELEVIQAKERPRKLSLAFVYGVSGIGKTYWVQQFAKYVAEREEMDMTQAIYDAPTSKQGNAKDYYFLSDYDNQPITIIDDVSPVAFEYNNFLKIFDDNKIVTIRNRNKDKAWLSEKCFMIKSTASPTDFFKEIYENAAAKYWTEKENVVKQVTRRVSWIIKVEKDCVLIHKNDDGFLNGKKTISFDYSSEKDANQIEKLNEKVYNLLYK